MHVVNTSSDMSAYGPQSVLASVNNDWTAYFVAHVEDKMSGSFEGSDFRGGLANGAVKVAAWGDALDAEQLAEIKAVEAKLVSGELHAFAGPLRDQDGMERAAAGTNLADEAIFGMNWLVEGLEGSLPQ